MRAFLGGCLVLLALTQCVAAQANEPEQALPERPGDAWVVWNLVENTTREAVESAHYRIPAGLKDFKVAVQVRNNLSRPIENATLTFAYRGAPLNWSFGPTYAGDPPQRDYAYWPILPPRSLSLVSLTVETPDDSRGDFELVALLTYTDENETYLSRTRFAGEVVGSAPALVAGVVEPRPPYGPFALGVGVGAAVVGVVMFVSRRKVQ